MHCIHLYEINPQQNTEKPRPEVFKANICQLANILQIFTTFTSTTNAATTSTNELLDRHALDGMSMIWNAVFTIFSDGTISLFMECWY